MLFLTGFALMLAGIVTTVVVARKSVNRSGDLLEDAAFGAINALDAGFGGFFGESSTSTPQQAASRGFSAMIKSMFKSQIEMAKKNWKLLLMGILGWAAIGLGVICMVVWFVHFLWNLVF